MISEQALRELVNSMPHNGTGLFSAVKNVLGHDEYCYKCKFEALLSRPASEPLSEERPDVFDFVGQKIAEAFWGTIESLQGFKDDYRMAGESALEEFWFRATGKHADIDELRVRAAVERSGKGEPMKCPTCKKDRGDNSKLVGNFPCLDAFHSLPHNSRKDPNRPYCKTVDCWAWHMTGSDYCALHQPAGEHSGKGEPK